MVKFRPFLVLGTAVIIALITSFLIYDWLHEKASMAKSTPPTQTVAVAATDLPRGAVLTRDATKALPFFNASLPEGYYSDPASLAGRVLTAPVLANEPILENRLAPTSVKTGGVAAVITPKKRAIAVRVDKTIGVSGFIHPGNRVDVLVTLPTGKAPAAQTKTVLENILVLATGPETDTKGKEDKPSNVDVITIEVTPEEAEKVALAASEGKLQLALRNFSDTADVITSGTTIPTLLASYSYRPVKDTKKGTRRSAPQKKSTAFTIELIKGSKTSEVKFERSE